MQVCMVEFAGRGGITHYTWALTRALAADDQIDIQLLTPAGYELAHRAADFRVRPLFVSHYRYPWLVLKGICYCLSLIRLFRYCMRHQPDILHVQQVRVPTLERLLYGTLRRRQIKIILTPHEILDPGRAKLSKARARLYQTVDAVIVLTREGEDRLAGLLNANTIPVIRYIAHGTYEQLVVPSESAREKLQIDRDAFVLLAFGHVRYSKGIDILVQAVRAVRELGYESVLLVAGEEAGDFSGLKASIRNSGLKDAVYWHGSYIPLEQVSDFFSAADVVVMPYREIDQSGVLFLAGGHGKPVIASRLPGFTEIVEEGISGFLVPPNDVTALTEAIVKAAKSDLSRMGKMLRERTRSTGDWTAIARQTLAVYQTISQSDLPQ